MTLLILFVLGVLFVVRSEIKHRQRQEDADKREGSSRAHD